MVINLKPITRKFNRSQGCVHPFLWLCFTDAKGPTSGDKRESSNIAMKSSVDRKIRYRFFSLLFNICNLTCCCLWKWWLCVCVCKRQINFTVKKIFSSSLFCCFWIDLRLHWSRIAYWALCERFSRIHRERKKIIHSQNYSSYTSFVLTIK